MASQTRITIPFAFALSGLGGVLMWLAHAPFALWPLGIVAAGLLWVSCAGQRSAVGALLGFVWGFVFFFLLFDWAHIAAGILLARVALAFAQAIFVAFLGALWAWLSRLFVVVETGKNRRQPRAKAIDLSCGTAAALLVAPLLWVAVEQLRSAVPFGGLPWGLLGFSQTGSPLMGLAPIGSTQLVGFAGVAAGISLVTALRHLGLHTGRSVLGIALSLSIIFIPGLFPSGGKPEGRLNVAIVQGGSPSQEELDDAPSRAYAVTKKHADATNAAAGSNIDLVLWPESASDHDVREHDGARALVSEAAVAIGAPILLGTQEYLDDGRYNDYVVYYPDGTFGQQYTKQHPVPFGEYIPFRDTFRSITPAVDQVTIDMLPGDAPAVLSVDVRDREIDIAVPICFEVAYSSIVAEAVADGGQLIVVPTNNATFGDSGEPYQQFEMTRFRAVEHGRTAIQVSTTGTTGVIDPNGVVRYETELFVTDARIVSVPLYSDITLATATEEYRTVLIYVLSVACLILAIYRQWFHRKGSAR